MKLLIASDVHGCAAAMRALEARICSEMPDRIILLGDILYHGPRNDLPSGYAPKEVAAILNSMADRLVCVRGNCDSEVDQMVLDFHCRADYVLIEVDGRLLYLTHGHVAHMMPDNPPALVTGSAFLFGHTHIKTLHEREGILFVNPGSISLPKDETASYATYENNVFMLKSLDGTVLCTHS